jgi:hypothetical protein
MFAKAGKSGDYSNQGLEIADGTMVTPLPTPGQSQGITRGKDSGVGRVLPA